MNVISKIFVHMAWTDMAPGQWRFLTGAVRIKYKQAKFVIPLNC